MEPIKDVRIDWVVDYYDGIRSGLGSYKGQTCYVVETDWNSGLFCVYALDEHATEYWRIKHEDFERLVGTHWCLHLPAGERRRSPADEQVDNYWQRHPPEPSEVGREPSGRWAR